jgi:signal transduction histidine kinase
LSNALKFSEKGDSVTIYYTLYKVSGKSYLEVHCVDTGRGIKRADKSKLFKLFGFVQTSLTTNSKGIGLGLVISKKIVESFGGLIGFKSKW